MKLAGWKGQYLSQGGRLTLIKSTLASVPIYSFSSFKAPKYICNKDDRIIKSIWWGHNPEEKKIHLKSWDSIYQNKSIGGTCIRKMEEMNKILLGKQAWKIIQKLDSLVASILLPKYCKDVPFT